MLRSGMRGGGCGRVEPCKSPPAPLHPPRCMRRRRPPSQAVRQRAELPRGRARRSAARLAQPHRGGDVHLVHIEAGCPRVDHVYVIGAQGVSIDSGTRHQIPPWGAERGARPVQEASTTRWGSICCSSTARSRVRFGARCQARSVSLSTGKGVASRYRITDATTVPFRPLQNATTPASEPKTPETRMDQTPDARFMTSG